MRSKTLTYLLIAVLSITVSCKDDKGMNTSDSSGVVLLDGYKQTTINDLVLIYQGGVHRLDWTQANFEPYVVHEDAQGKRDWFFDGFLFIEFKDGKGRGYASGYETLPARKTEWAWLIDRVFEEGKALSALDATIEQQIKVLGQPPQKHQVVLCLPEPIPDQKDWGELNGIPLNFSIEADRLSACRWYISELTNRYNNANYQHLNLAGFYWVSERITTNKGLTPMVGNYIRQAKKLFYWIPYWGAAGATDWRSLGFDVAYQQPNHFFNPDIPNNRINQACDQAYYNDMGMEMEFDTRALASNGDTYRDRMITYLDKFEKNGVFSKSAIAYYEGGGAIIYFANSRNPKDHELLDRLAALVQQRQK